MDDNEREIWVQCTKCQKWRVVPPTLKLAANWECRYNVFSADHNRCSAPQEKMPTEADEAVGTPLSITDEVFAKYSVVPADKHSLFSESTCSCTLCQEINNAVSAWDNAKMTEAHPIPLIACVLKSIANTAHIAEAVEEEKKFLYK